MDCRDCARYDAAAEEGQTACKDRKVNPKRWEEAVAVAQLMGIRAVCVFSDHRERLVASRQPTSLPKSFDRPRVQRGP